MLFIAFSQQVYSIQFDNGRKVRFDFQVMELSVLIASFA